MPSKVLKTDGGYYAIKGFTYQFDKSIFEILRNRGRDVTIEQIQDIGVDDYYIQVKYKETQRYSASKIRGAIIQLLDEFILDKKKRFCLYCYFKDKQPSKTVLNVANIYKILGSKRSLYNKTNIAMFAKHFSLEFSHDFYRQFGNVLREIKKSFGLKNDEEATSYHAIFRAHLLEVAIKKDRNQRVLTFQKLQKFVGKNEKIIFSIAYYKYLKHEKYLKYLKKEHFTFRKVNIPCVDRLFILEPEEFAPDSDLVQAIHNIQGKYFKKHSSPAPYICLINQKEEGLNTIKRKLWDSGMFFADGTHFDGDKFRIKDLVTDTHNNSSKETFKFFTDKELPSLLKVKSPSETFIFTTNPTNHRPLVKESKEFYIQRIKDIIKLIQ